MNLPARKAILFQLESALAVELGSALRGANCEVIHSTGDGPAAKADVVFCTSGASLYAAQHAFPRTPIVVVSRLPEPEEWIEVLQAGASDYAAAPFEAIQMRWVLEALGVNTLRAAAA
jgi:CheY-like chemotaxis protein